MMQVAKLNDGRIVEVFRYAVPVAFDTSRGDWVLISTPIGARPRKQNLEWVPATYVVWRLDFS